VGGNGRFGAADRGRRENVETEVALRVGETRRGCWLAQNKVECRPPSSSCRAGERLRGTAIPAGVFARRLGKSGGVGWRSFPGNERLAKRGVPTCVKGVNLSASRIRSGSGSSLSKHRHPASAGQRMTRRRRTQRANPRRVALMAVTVVFPPSARASDLNVTACSRRCAAAAAACDSSGRAAVAALHQVHVGGDP